MSNSEVLLTKEAKKVFEEIALAKAASQQKSYESLMKKSMDAIKSMLDSMVMEVKIDLDDQDMPALVSVTEELRNLGYKFRFIEIYNSVHNETVGHKLLISIEHLATTEGV